MSKTIQLATEAYVACALHFALDHKGPYRGATASDFLDATWPYDANVSRWHEAASEVVKLGEEALGLVESSEGSKKCLQCRDQFRLRAGETFGQFRRRNKCYACARLHVKVCTVCGEEYSKPPRRALKSWATSKYCSRDCQNA